MLFNLVRIVLLLIISVLVVLKIKKTNIVPKKTVSVFIIVLCLGLIAVSGMFPVENSFINFKSPESVFNYTNFGKINDVLYGEESCAVIYSSKNSTNGYYIMPKAEKGYKIPSCVSAKRISHKFDKSGNFDVYKVLGTNDYYVIGTVLSNSDRQNIADNNNNPVKNIVTEMGSTKTKTVFIYSYVKNFANEYYFIINGKKTIIAD